MIICDQVHQDRATGKHTIMGIFQNLHAQDFPAVHPSLALYIELTNGHGTVPIEIKFVRMLPDDPEGEVLASLKGNIPFESPLAVGALVMQLGNLPIPEPGEYRFRLECDGILVIERRFLAAQLKKDHE